MADNETRYNRSILMFGDVEIVCKTFKPTYKVDSEDYTASNSSVPYDASLGDITAEAEASDIDPLLRPVLKKIMLNKEKRTLVSYDYDEDTGNLIEDDVFYKAYIKELSKENNTPFSVKFGITSFKKPE